ncbi:hypothetical protein HAX54_009303 [Datura stramonium]|uniref:Uncharacterized protein n=1 Tax=Datura stramonium TaxID=4076 RepID=A0ABS8TGG6_DATST|nr:hypothetical protein [Datura stramonium]
MANFIAPREGKVTITQDQYKQYNKLKNMMDITSTSAISADMNGVDISYTSNSPDGTLSIDANILAPRVRPNSETVEVTSDMFLPDHQVPKETVVEDEIEEAILLQLLLHLLHGKEDPLEQLSLLYDCEIIVVPLNWTVGMVGILAGTVEDALLVYAAIGGPKPSHQSKMPMQPKLCFPLLKSPKHTPNIRLAKYGEWFNDCSDEIRVCCSRALAKLHDNYGWESTPSTSTDRG